MKSFDEQIVRIKEKLFLAQKADKNLKVFGAAKHKYMLNRPATLKEIENFEIKYSVSLPECYKSFLKNIGNGGAGPFYGIYSVGVGVDELMSCKNTGYLSRDCIISPEMPDSYWLSLSKKLDENEHVSNADYEKALSEVFGGILFIGNQGCTYYHGIVLNGKHRGKVVNLDSDSQKPQFTYEDNFLDWYERWLDEVISGDLMKDGPSWFGYLMSGTGYDLIHRFLSSEDEGLKLACLKSILNFKNVDHEITEIIKQQISAESGNLKIKLIELLTKFDYEMARPYLLDLSESNLLFLFQFISWYAPERSGEWLNIIKPEIDNIKDAETLRFYILLLEKVGGDYGQTIIPFTNSRDQNIRSEAFYSLGRLNNRRYYLEYLVKGLHDESNQVVHTTLQALSGLKDWELFNHYKEVARRFTKDEYSILTNLNNNLRVFGYDNVSILENEEPNKVKEKWYRFW